MWQEPIFDRTNADTLTARAGQSNIEDHKGALNYQDLNRIEDNFQYVVRHLFANAMVISHTKRAYAETTYEIITKEVEEFPEGCTRLAYIESAGAQYINTEVYTNKNTRVVMDATVLSTANTGGGAYFFGSMTAHNSTGIEAFTWDTIFYGCYNKVQYSSGTVLNVGDRITIDFDKNNCTVKRNQIEIVNISIPQADNISTIPLHLFELARENYKGVFRLHSCKIYDDGTLVRDYIPVLDWDNVPCLYDKVTHKLYYNAGTGSFEYTIPVELPEGFTQVEFIESSGTQYIDTDFTPNQDTRVLADVELKIEGSNYFMFGARQNSTGSSTAAATFGFNAYNTLYRMHYYNGYSGSDFATTVLFDYKFHIDFNKNVLTLDSQYTMTRTYAQFTAPCTMTIFAVNTAGTVGTFAKAKVYTFKIFDNGELVRDFVPVLNIEGIAGLYDTVHGVFYPNKGSGAFTFGAMVPKPQVPEAETGYEEVTTVYTDWQEHNVPWKSEIDRIRENFNNLTNLFLRTLNLPIFKSSDYLMYTEVNDWERVSLVGKTMFENMEKEYVYSGTIDCGGDRLL